MHGLTMSLELFFFFFIHAFQRHYALFGGSCVLFTVPISTLLKKKLKNGSYDTIYTFKNYFITIFSVFSKINGI